MSQHPTPEEREPRQLARREFLVLSGAALALTGCEAGEPPPGTSKTPVRAAHPFTVEQLLNTTPFHIAHRGSGDNWTEHTLSAYAGALAAGAQAIEVSVHMSADGVFVCHHDTNLERMTGVDRDIATVAYRDLAQVQNDARSWLGPAAELQPIPALRDVLDKFAANCVIFIEDKTGSHARELLKLLDSYPNSTSHFVWKQTAASEQFKLAKQRGYKVWGYFVDNKDGAFARYAERFDLLGIYHGATDEEIRALVGFGIPVICWEIHTRWMRDRVLKLGVTGLMCSNYLYVAHDRVHQDKDAFATGLRAPGDLPWILSPKYQPIIEAKSGAVSLGFDASAAYQLGSLCPVTVGTYAVIFDMRWPDRQPAGEQNAGISFGAADDQPYRPTVAGAVGGYHLICRVNGQVQLFRRDPGVDPGDPISSFASDQVVPGEWASFKIEVTPKVIRFSRIGDPAWTREATDGAYRGGYLALNKNYATSEPVEFRAVSIAEA